MTVGDWAKVAELGWSVVVAGVAAVAWYNAWQAKKHQATRKEFNTLHGRVTALSERVTRAEGRLDDAPTAKALHDLALAIEGLKGELKSQHARFDGLEKILGRLETITDRQEQHLLSEQRAGR